MKGDYIMAKSNNTGRSSSPVNAEATVAKAREEGKTGPEKLLPSESALAATLESIQREGRAYETNGTGKVAQSVLVYLEEKQRLAGNVAITTDLPTLRTHCYDLVKYRTKDDQGADTSSDAFESCVRRGIEAALLMHNNVKGLHIATAAESKEMAGKIVAQANVLIPNIDVPLPGTKGKKVSVANPSSELVPVTVRALDTLFRDAFPNVKGKRSAHSNKATKPAKTRDDLKEISLSILMLEVTARLNLMVAELKGTEREVAVDLLMVLDKRMEGDAVAA